MPEQSELRFERFGFLSETTNETQGDHKSMSRRQWMTLRRLVSSGLWREFSKSETETHSNNLKDTTLPWSTRMKITQDTAPRLDYLHQGMEFQVSTPVVIYDGHV